MNGSQLTCSMSYLCQIGYPRHFEGVEHYFNKLFYNERATRLGMLPQEQEQPCSESGRQCRHQAFPPRQVPKRWKGKVLTQPLAEALANTRHAPHLPKGLWGHFVIYKLLSPAPPELHSGAAGSASCTDACGAPWASRHLPQGALQKEAMLEADKSQLLSLDCRFLTLLNMMKSLQI